jgi:hypothetical protein
MRGDAALVLLDIATRLEADRIEFERLVALLEGEQTIRVPDDIRVGDATIGADDGRVCASRVEAVEQRSSRGILQSPFWRADVAIAIAHLAVRDEETVDHAVAGEPVVAPARLELGVGAVAVKRASQGAGDRPDDLQVVIVLAANGREIAGQIGVARRQSIHGADSQRLESSGIAPAVLFAHSALPLSYKQGVMRRGERVERREIESVVARQRPVAPVVSHGQ